MGLMSKKRIERKLCSAIGVVLITACSSVAPAATTPQSADSAGSEHQRLIIKFKLSTLECDADGIAKLSSATGVRIEFVRPISGESCVITQYADSPESLLQGQEVVRQHPAVEWLEQDRKMKALMQK
jgi:hypothetical protein